MCLFAPVVYIKIFYIYGNSPVCLKNFYRHKLSPVIGHYKFHGYIALLFAEIASDVEPPVADEHDLAELGPVGAQEGRLSPVYVAVVPRLASRLRIGVEARVGLLVAVEVRVGHQAQHRVVRARPSWKVGELNTHPASDVVRRDPAIYGIKAIAFRSEGATSHVLFCKLLLAARFSESVWGSRHTKRKPTISGIKAIEFQWKAEAVGSSAADGLIKISLLVCLQSRVCRGAVSN